MFVVESDTSSDLVVLLKFLLFKEIIMKTISDLTEQQFKSLLDEYYATPDKRTKLTSSEIKDIAKRLNSKIDVPIITETREEKILIKIVMKVDNFLYDNLPNEFYELVRSMDSCIDDNEAKRLIKRLSKLANDKIDIPYVPESMEYIAIRFVIGIVINAARKQWDIYRVQSISHTLNIPSSSVVSDEELDGILA